MVHVDEKLWILVAFIAIIAVLTLVTNPNISTMFSPRCNLPNIPAGCIWVSAATPFAPCAGHVSCPANATINYTSTVTYTTVTYTTINYTYGNCSGNVCTVKPGQRISNFELLRINTANQTVLGYEWIEYPVARAEPINATLRIGQSIGYSCDGTLATLTAINQTYATFVLNTTRSKYGCPI